MRRYPGSTRITLCLTLVIETGGGGGGKKFPGTLEQDIGKYVGEIVKGSGTHYEMFPNSTFHSAFLFPGQVSYCADSIISVPGAIGFT